MNRLNQPPTTLNLTNQRPGILNRTASKFGSFRLRFVQKIRKVQLQYPPVHRQSIMHERGRLVRCDARQGSLPVKDFVRRALRNWSRYRTKEVREPSYTRH